MGLSRGFLRNYMAIDVQSTGNGSPVPVAKKLVSGKSTAPGM